MRTTTHTSSTPSGSWVDGPMLGFDLETTGVDRFSDVPVSAALVVAEGGKVLSTDYFIIDPGRLIPPGASAIHGISTEQAGSEGISLTEALARIYDAISAAQAARWPIVGMNLSYDLTMLDVLARAHLGCEISPAGLYVLDALVIDRHIDTYRRGKRKLVNLAVVCTTASRSPTRTTPLQTPWVRSSWWEPSFVDAQISRPAPLRISAPARPSGTTRGRPATPPIA